MYVCMVCGSTNCTAYKIAPGTTRWLCPTHAAMQGVWYTRGE